MAHTAGTQIRLRPRRSETRPATGAARATPSVDAETVHAALVCAMPAQWAMSERAGWVE